MKNAAKTSRYLTLFKLEEDTCGCIDERDVVASYATEEEARKRLLEEVEKHKAAAREVFSNFALDAAQSAIHPDSIPRYGRIYTWDAPETENLPSLDELLDNDQDVIFRLDKKNYDLDDQMDVLRFIEEFQGSSYKQLVGDGNPADDDDYLGTRPNLSSAEFRLGYNSAMDYENLVATALESLIGHGVVTKIGKTYWHVPSRYKPVLHAVGFLEQTYREGVASKLVGSELQRSSTDVEVALKWLVKFGLIAPVGDGYLQASTHRQNEYRKQAAEYGKRGGNPALRKQKSVPLEP